MAQWGLSGAPIPSWLPYAKEINEACVELDAPPCAMYAIAWRETLSVADWIMHVYGKTAAEFISSDGGHGVFQLTASVPDDWADAYANAKYAIAQFYDPAVKYWLAAGYTGDTLFRLAADCFNEGLGNEELAHLEGNADKYTTGSDYGEDCVIIYENLINGRPINQGRPQ
jgi:hypothetical protein